MALSHEVGFYGIAEIDSTTMLATGGSITLTQDPMFSTGVWGAGWYNAANQVAYAFNAVTLEGDISFELSAGDIFTTVKNFALEQRIQTHNVVVKPNGQGGFDGNAYCTGCSFDASEGSVVTGSLNFASDETTGFSATPAIENKTGVGTAPAPDSLFPYWNTCLKADTVVVPVTTWSASYSSAVNFLTLCQCRTVTPPPQPDFVMIGGMDAEGSYTVFGLSDQVSVATLQDAKTVEITMTPVSGTPGVITFADVLYNSAGISIVTGGDYITADLSFTAVGDGNNPPMLLA